MPSRVPTVARRNESTASFSIVFAAIRTLLGCVLFALVAAPLAAQGTKDGSTLRALLIGINTYHYPTLAANWRADLEKQWGARLGGPPSNAGAAPVEKRAEVPDLFGPVSDARAMKSVLQVRFGFSDIALLEDSAATRAGILAAIRQLIDRSKPGDVVVFYYAGHGSQRLNTRAPASATANQLDQTIVPADANVEQFDIRNVELNQLFDQLLAKNVRLTLIFDSCHSGSAVRGLPVPGHYRLAPFDLRDAADPTDVTPISSVRRANRALFLAAAQESQLAAEDSARDPVDNQFHGAFTRALLDVLRTSSLDLNAPAQEIFKQVQAIMRWRGATQVPVLQGTDGDADRPLFGTVTGVRARRITLAYQGSKGGVATLDGGAVIGLGEGSELVGGDRAGHPVRLRLSAARTLTTSQATAVQGDLTSMDAGTLFTLDASKVSTEMRLDAWVPAAETAARLKPALAAFAELRNAAAVEWITDPTEIPDDGRPLYLISHNGTHWQVTTPQGKSITLVTPTAQTALAAITPDVRAGRPRVYLLVPPTPELRRALGVDSAGSSMIRVSPRLEAGVYALFGQLGADGSVSYAWVRPNSTASSQRLSPFPARTDFVRALTDVPAANAAGADTLATLAERLGRLQYWLTVEPQDAGIFSYDIGLHGADPAHDVLKFRDDSVPDVGGENYTLVLRKPPTDQRIGDERYVYVFYMDSHGDGALLFGTSRNRLPATDAGNQPLADALIPLPQVSFSICPPYGMDTFIMVASADAVPNPSVVFNLEGVRTRGILASAVATNWTVRRLSIPSIAPPPGSKLAQAVAAQCR